MKRCFPGGMELLVFAALAMICATIAGSATAQDTALSLLAFPLILVAALMGLWRAGRLRG